jgi:hypothetical protein
MAAGINIVSGANAAKAATLPTAVAGTIVLVKNADAAVLPIFPATGDKINGQTATTGHLDMAASVSALFFAKDATDWYSLPLLPS